MPAMPPFQLAVFEFGTDYELATLQMMRKRLFLQSEAAGRSTIEWGRRVGGHLVKHAFAEVSVGLCDGAVQMALNEFRPLGFTLAFKIQDAVAELVLGASGVARPADLTFSVKRKELARLRSSCGLVEPEVLAANPKIGEAWWNLYCDLEPFRGAIHHSGTVVRYGDGGLQITTLRPRRLGSTLALTSAELGSYVRIACLVAEGVLHSGGFDALRRRLVANDVADLARVHGVAGASEGPAKLERVKLLVAEEFAGPKSSISFEIDFDEVAAAASAPLIDLEIEATCAGRVVAWSVPADSYPCGKRVVREGDPDFDRWRVL